MNQPRCYLMCEPAHFRVEYAINPWMDPRRPVDTGLAVKQWQRLRETLLDLGPRVLTVAPRRALRDWVSAANSAWGVDGTASGARFRSPRRAGGAAASRAS